MSPPTSNGQGRRTGPDNKEAQIRKDVLLECDRVIAIGPSAPVLTLEGVATATGWSRSVLYKHSLTGLIKAKIKEQRRLRSDRGRSRDETIARLRDELANAKAENDGLRARIVFMEEAAYAAGVKPDTLYAPVAQPSRSSARPGVRRT
jgi:hypothetical protein